MKIIPATIFAVITIFCVLYVVIDPTTMIIRPIGVWELTMASLLSLVGIIGFVDIAK